MRLPKIPRGLASRIKREEKKVLQKKAIEARKKEILAMRKKLEMLKRK